MDLRPNSMVLQRDSDAGKNVDEARANAFGRFASVEVQTGSRLLEQFHGDYIPRVFHFTLPRFVGGPDLANRPRFRHGEEAAAVPFNAFCRIMPRKAEAQMRWDWNFIPAVWSLSFYTRISLALTMAYQRALRSGGYEP